MQIELVGCTSAGKTTLARELVAVGRKLGIDAELSDDFLMHGLGLNSIKNEFVRRRLIELWALMTCLMFLRKYHGFYRFVMQICFMAPGSLMYRLKLARVVLRKIGIYEIIRHRSTDQQMILLDNEGMLQAAHTLFVHPHAESYREQLFDFLRQVPLPDVIVYLQQPASVLIERTHRRGHNRIQAQANVEDVAGFIRQAVFIFEEIKHCPAFADRLLVIDGEKNELVTSWHDKNPKVERVADLISAEMEMRTRFNRSEMEHDDSCATLRAVSSVQR